jgi:protein gp37
MSTKIGWTNETWNPVTGCSKVSPGCAHCYAETLALTRLAGRPGYPGLPWTPENAEANVVLRPDRLDLPLRWRKPRMIFVNSMSDLFHERVPDEFIAQVCQVMLEARHHQFQVLTKRPERMRDFMAWRHRLDGEYARKFDDCPTEAMRNSYAARCAREWAAGPPYGSWVWLGTSIENDRFVGRADALRETPAAVRFISAEPLLGPLPSLDLTGIDWLIIGGESGPGFRPMDPMWVHALVVQADIAGTAVFVKQASGARAGKQGNLPDDLWARKAYPS